MASSIGLSALVDFKDRFGINVVGDIPTGLPPPLLPNLSTSDIVPLLPGALQVAAVGYIGTIALGKQFGAKYGYQVDSNAELIASGAANIVAAFFQSQPSTMR